MESRGALQVRKTFYDAAMREKSGVVVQVISGQFLTDLIEVNTLELVKVSANDNGSDLWSWLQFIKTGSREVMDMLAAKSPELKKAVGFLMDLSEDERTRLINEDREKARRDYNSRFDGAKREGEETGLAKGRIEGKNEGKIEGKIEGKEEAAQTIGQRAISMGMNTEDIVKLTGLSYEQIMTLKRG